MKLMHSCAEVSRLLSKALDEPLGLLDRGLLQVHLSMCGSCRDVDEQLRELHGMTQDLFATEEAGEPEPAAPGAANGGSPRGS
ncbi:MAG: zf-HC2 domain-containing protein [Burkholderiales bacterium]|nr:zf-HC2 domain-containing protein [Burkholderiales bacterium]